MALAQDLMGLGLPHSLALHIAEGGSGPVLIVAAGSSYATATKIGSNQGAVYCTTADSTKGVSLPTVGSNDGPLFVDDFIIANVPTTGSDCLKIFASAGVTIAAGGSNTSVTAIAGNTAIILYPVTTSQWVAIKARKSMPASFTVLSCAGKDAARWQSLIDRLPLEYRDILFTPAYARIQQSLGQGPCFAAVYEWDDYFILQPFMQRGQELASFYGGGGPISNLMGAADYRLWLWFDQEFAKWRKDCKITAEYVRLHPLFDKEQRRMLRESTIKIEHLREAVVVDIDKDDDKLLKSFSRNRQRGVKEGPQYWAARFNDTEAFAGLYKESMQRLQANDAWKYPDHVWGTYRWELDDEYASFFVTRDALAVPVGALLILHAYGKSYAHFLGGKGNDRLYYESMKYCRDIGCKTYFMGGGTTSDADDSLLAYKSGFSQLRVPVSFYKRSFAEERAHVDLLTTQSA